MARSLFDRPWRGLCLIFVACLGCDAPAPSSGPPTSASVTRTSKSDGADSQTTATTDEVTASSSPLELRGMNWGQVQAFAAEHTGKVVVIDVWSTACEPCLHEFPHLVSLQHQYATDVVCVSFDCDYIGAKNKPVDFYRARVLEALTELKAESIVNLMSNVAADDLFQQMDIDSIPAVYVFDREGKLSKRFDNRTPVGDGTEGISYEKQIEPLVAELVAKAGP